MTGRIYVQAVCLFATPKYPLDITSARGLRIRPMENILSFVGQYWPHLLALLFFAIMAFNFRSWFKGRQTQGDGKGL